MHVSFHHKALLTLIVSVFVYNAMATIVHASDEIATLKTEGNIYHLTCSSGAITIFAPLGSVKGISGQMVTKKWVEHKERKLIQRSILKDKIHTNTRSITCEPSKKPSAVTTQNKSVVSTTAEAGEWMCKGENLEFSIKGFLARRRPDGTWDTSGSNKLNWIIAEPRECEFIMD